MINICNTLKFVSLKIELNWFIYIFLCSWKYRKIKIFIELKFIIGVATFLCIHAGAYILLWCMLVVWLCDESDQTFQIALVSRLSFSTCRCLFPIIKFLISQLKFRLEASESIYFVTQITSFSFSPMNQSLKTSWNFSGFF